ncbi:DUF309 domain-containing protein [Paenibacillus sp. 1P07SE]|uniref:DUF309 domain-containing protein n=1 Tax=Paenibacillus sp. 1P07SE TaxID=3132209 RepID=UPI0039A786FD
MKPSSPEIYPDNYIQYLIEFHVTRDYFECHELLEEYWKEQPGDHPLYNTWVGLIQIAVSQYHLRRTNRRGARLMLEQALDRLTPNKLDQLGLDGPALMELLKQRLRQIKDLNQAVPYTDYELPFQDPSLLEICQDRSGDAAALWGAPSRMEDDSLIHRHTLRDRSEVIAARQAAIIRRKHRREAARSKQHG